MNNYNNYYYVWEYRYIIDVSGVECFLESELMPSGLLKHVHVPTLCVSFNNNQLCAAIHVCMYMCVCEWLCPHVGTSVYYVM